MLTKIGGEGRNHSPHIRAVFEPRGQTTNGKGVAEILQTWRITCFIMPGDIGKFAYPPKGLIRGADLDRRSILIQKKM